MRFKFALFALLIIQLNANADSINYENLTPDEAKKAWNEKDHRSEKRKRYKEWERRNKERMALDHERLEQSIKEINAHKKWSEDYTHEKEKIRAIRKAQLENEQIKRETRIKYCNSLKDEMRNYNEFRTRWYKLDKNGQRVYLDDDEILKNRKSLEDKIAEKCGKS